MATTTAKKPAAKKPANAKPTAAPVALVTDEVAATADAAAAKSGALKKKELIARVTEAVGGKKKGVKEVVEATLAVLGAALQSGEGLNLPPFGKARVAKAKGEGKSAAMTVKLRGAGEKKTPKEKQEALAEVGEDS